MPHEAIGPAPPPQWRTVQVVAPRDQRVIVQHIPYAYSSWRKSHLSDRGGYSMTPGGKGRPKLAVGMSLEGHWRTYVVHKMHCSTVGARNPRGRKFGTVVKLSGLVDDGRSLYKTQQQEAGSSKQHLAANPTLATTNSWQHKPAGQPVTVASSSTYQGSRQQQRESRQQQGAGSKSSISQQGQQRPTAGSSSSSSSRKQKTTKPAAASRSY